MAGIKITDLPGTQGAPALLDVLPIVDISDDVTKKVTVFDLISSVTVVADASGTAEQIRVAQAIEPGTYYLHFGQRTTGYDSVNVAGDLTYDPSGGILTANFFVGDGSQLTGVLADSALNSTFAVVAERANTADNALTADSAINATNAINAVNADSAVNASFALNANTALSSQVADSAVNASNAILAQNSISADSATNATFANTAFTAVRAITADSATFANTADTALFANVASTADSATNATNAIFAQSAETASIADSAVRASQADLAVFALASANDLENVRDSGTGIRVLGETTIDSDLFVKGIISGDGSGLTNVSAVTNSLVTDQINAVAVDSAIAHYVMLRTDATGYDSVHTKATILFDPSTDTLSATKFSGDGSGLTNVSALTATNASAVEVSTVSDSATYYVHVGSTATGFDNVNTDVDLTYNPQSNRLRTKIFGTQNWDIYEESGQLIFEQNGIKKVKFDSSGNILATGSILGSQTL